MSSKNDVPAARSAATHSLPFWTPVVLSLHDLLAACRRFVASGTTSKTNAGFKIRQTQQRATTRNAFYMKSEIVRFSEYSVRRAFHFNGQLCHIDRVLRLICLLAQPD
jgi:hypothetical protein